MNRTRWLILILGPLPIVGSSLAVSGWVKTDPHEQVASNHVVADALSDATPMARRDEPRSSGPCPVENEDGLARACRQSAERLAKELGRACQVITRPPFVLAGDLGTDELDAWHENTIVPAVRAMQNCYFSTPPTQPISVLLFRNEESYNRYARELFDESGISIYGYYKPNCRTLLMNVATGGGTLLHELTHALVDFDFPDAPSWFNEGLASLHEQCRFRTDSDGPWIEGMVNWRLKGLQEAARQGRLRSLAALIEDRDFRGPLVGTNYAQARYFCLYMQEQGVLREFFHTFRGDQAHDPRGLQSVAKVFGNRSWPVLDQDFQRWLLELAE